MRLFLSLSLAVEALMNCWVNFSADTYSTFFLGYFSLISTPIACAKCVLPNPTPPKINKGLNAVPPGLLATAIPAERANLFDSPSTKLSKFWCKFSCGSTVISRMPGITNGFFSSGSLASVANVKDCLANSGRLVLGSCFLSTGESIIYINRAPSPKV